MQIPIDEIFSDDTFNCRGEIYPYEVADLAKDIEENGLIQPVVVQPWDKEPGFNYRLVVGHRRHLACKLLQMKTIEAVIKNDLDERHAMALNLSENIQRVSLNIQQEAKAVEKFRLKGLTMNEIADILSVSNGWVQIRFALLKLPVEVQKEAAAGFITHAQIRELAAMDSREDIFSHVRAIKEHKQRGERGSFRIPKKNNLKKHEAKRRQIPDIFSMQEYIQEAVGNNLATRALAWAAGVITTDEMFLSIKEQATKEGKIWEIPVDD